MEIKVRNLHPNMVNELNRLADSYGISREELVRQILDDYVAKNLLEENPLLELIEDNQKVLKEVKAVLLSVESRIHRT